MKTREPEHYNLEGFGLYLHLLKRHSIWLISSLIIVNVLFYTTEVPLKINEFEITEPYLKSVVFTSLVILFHLIATTIAYFNVKSEKEYFH